MISGRRMVRRSGFASARVLIVRPLDQHGRHQRHQHHGADRHQRDEGSREANVAAGSAHHLLEEGRAGRQAGEEHHNDVWLRQGKDLGDEKAQGRPQHPAPHEDERQGFLIPQRGGHLRHPDLEAHGRQVRHGEDQHQGAKCGLQKMHDSAHGLSPFNLIGIAAQFEWLSRITPSSPWTTAPPRRRRAPTRTPCGQSARTRLSGSKRAASASGAR